MQECVVRFHRDTNGQHKIDCEETRHFHRRIAATNTIITHANGMCVVIVKVNIVVGVVLNRLH